MTKDIKLIPLEAINPKAMERDRVVLEPEALRELVQSIAATGLRMPVEVYEMDTPGKTIDYGLISGFRRLTAFHKLREILPSGDWARIPAFVREPTTQGEAVAAMIEENEIRSELSPFERGRAVVLAVEQGLFGTIEEAVEALHPAATKQKLSRLRSLARMAGDIEGFMTEPEKLSQTKALRLAAAFRNGLADVIQEALQQSSQRDHEGQWQLILPYLEESENLGADAPDPGLKERLGRPRRISTPRHGLNIRRERTRDGWLLRFSGREATSDLLDVVFFEIERLFGPK